MLLRGALAVGGMVAVPMAIGTVHAEEKKEQCSSCTYKMKAKQLPLYKEPELPEYEYVQEKTNKYTETVSATRSAVFNYYDSIKDTRDKVQDKWGVAKAHTNDLLNTLQEDSGVVPRAVFITVAGLGGVVAGYKGGIIRKSLLAATGMGGAAAICYPNQAVDLSKQGWGTIRDNAKEMWAGSPVKTDKPTSEKSAPIATKITEEANKSVDKLADTTEPQEEKTSPKVEGDPGMSKPEDKDMYSTRSS